VLARAQGAPLEVVAIFVPRRGAPVPAFVSPLRLRVVTAS
jgi:hypothetical protein